MPAINQGRRDISSEPPCHAYKKGRRARRGHGRGSKDRRGTVRSGRGRRRSSPLSFSAVLCSDGDSERSTEARAAAAALRPRPPRRRRADEHRPAPPPSCSALAEAAAHAAGGAPTPESKPPLPLLLPPLSPLYLSELSLEPKSLAPPPHCSVSPLAQAAAVEAIAALPLARRPALCSVQLPLSPLPRLPSAPPQHEPRRIALRPGLLTAGALPSPSAFFPSAS